MSDVKHVHDVVSASTTDPAGLAAGPDRRWWSRCWGSGRAADRYAQWSPETMASHRRCDVMEPPSRRAVALLSAARMATLR